MQIAFHTTSPAPRIPGTDAVHNETARLREAASGWLNGLYPFRTPGHVRARALYGMQGLGRLLWLDAHCDLHHVFCGDAFPYAVLRCLRKPVLYSVVAGVERHPNRNLLRQHRWIVGSERDARALRAAMGDVSDTVGPATRVSVIRPGIDVRRIHRTPLPDGPFTLLCATAPWREAQVSSKGFDAILHAMLRMADIRLILLLRGHCGDALRSRIANLGLTERVELVDGLTDINALLRRSHAAFALAATPGLIRSHPHSLLEAIAAGRPVLISACIPMADEVAAHRFGATCASLAAGDVHHALAQLRANHAQFMRACGQFGREFADDRESIRLHLDLYERVVSERRKQERHAH